VADTVRLQDIVDALEMQFDEYSSFLDLDAGTVETVSHALLEQAEESSDDDKPELPDWQQQEWEMAKLILSTDRFLKLPDRFDIHEWAIMQDFSLSVTSEAIRQDLLHAIQGAGAFRHFRSAIRRHRIESDWYAFRSEALKRIAIDWCEENQIAWR
jgi:hypothetical protein